MSACYNSVERTPLFATAQVIRVGKALGFTRGQVVSRLNMDRLRKGFTYSRRERFYQLVGELVALFENKGGEHYIKQTRGEKKEVEDGAD